MNVVSVAWRNKTLLALAVVVGIFLAMFSLYKITFNPEGPRLEPARLSTYSSTLNAVIDTSDFGIGRSDTDVVKLSYWAPTYAQLLTTQPVLQRAEAALGRPVGVEQGQGLVTAEQVGQSPMIQVRVEATSPEQASATAGALVEALADYIGDTQESNSTPADKRLTVRVMGQPSQPTLVSNRRRELAFVLFLLPVIVALVVAYRLEGGVLMHSAESTSGLAENRGDHTGGDSWRERADMLPGSDRGEVSCRP